MNKDDIIEKALEMLKPLHGMNEADGITAATCAVAFLIRHVAKAGPVVAGFQGVAQVDPVAHPPGHLHRAGRAFRRRASADQRQQRSQHRRDHMLSHLSLSPLLKRMWSAPPGADHP